MIWTLLASVALAAVGVYAFVGSIYAENPGAVAFGQAQIIYASVPWVTVGGLVAASALAMWAAARKRSLIAGSIGTVELGLLAYLSYILMTAGALPAHALSRSVGDAFPVFELRDHTGAVVSSAKGSAAGPALYVFYRGDW